MLLKEKLIDMMRSDNSLFTQIHFMSPGAKRDQYSLPGLILKAFNHSLQARVDAVCPGWVNGRLPLSAPYLYSKWVEYERTVVGKIFDDIAIEVPALARQLWEEVYGEHEARELPFYQGMLSNTAYSWVHSSDFDCRFVIEYLRGRRSDLRLLKPPAGK